MPTLLQRILGLAATGAGTGGGTLRGRFSSSAISTYEYDTNTGLLILTFHKAPGGPYYYYNVPQAVVRGLISAGSKGSYFNAAIRGRFE